MTQRDERLSHQQQRGGNSITRHQYCAACAMEVPFTIAHDVLTQLSFSPAPPPTTQLVNLWRTEQSIELVAPYIISHRADHNGADPSIAQIREKLKELPWNQFVYQFAITSLRELHRIGREVI